MGNFVSNMFSGKKNEGYEDIDRTGQGNPSDAPSGDAIAGQEIEMASVSVIPDGETFRF